MPNKDLACRSFSEKGPSHVPAHHETFIRAEASQPEYQQIYDEGIQVVLKYFCEQADT